jgi:enolase
MGRLRRAAASRVEIVGDDYLTTDAARVRAAATDAACNAVLVKPNQAGTLTEAWRRSRRAGCGFATIVSARSGETEDVSIVHLAVGWNAGRLKVGSFARSSGWQSGTKDCGSRRRSEARRASPARRARLAPRRPAGDRARASARRAFERVAALASVVV